MEDKGDTCFDEQGAETPHFTVNEAEYACVLKPMRPAANGDHDMHQKGQLGATPTIVSHMEVSYENSGTRVMSGQGSAACSSKYEETDFVYSLAEPVEDDLVVVENDLYGS